MRLSPPKYSTRPIGERIRGSGVQGRVFTRALVGLLSAGTLVALAACASSGARPAGAAEDLEGSRVQTAILQNASGGAVGVNMVANTSVNRVVVPAAPDAAFQALSGAYGRLNITVTDLNQAARTLGNPTFKARRRIGDVATMRALDCGGDTGMPNAETYQLTLSIRSRVIAGEVPGTSVVESTVEGTGRSPTTAASSDVRCSSLGALEKRIGDLVKEILAAGK